MKRQNVLHLVEYLYLGGIERVLEQLALKTGDKAKIHFFSYETENLMGIGKQIQDSGFPVFNYKKKKGRDLKLFKELVRVIKENKIDVIHTHDFGPIEYAVLLKIRFPSIRLIHTQHTMVHFIKNRKYTLFFQFASYFYYKIISVSSFVQETILEYCKRVNRSALIIIPNGVDTEIYKKSLFQNKKSRLNLVSISRISSEKNLDYIFNTCRLLNEEGIPFVLHHAGTAKRPELLEKVIKYLDDYSLHGKVVLHGFTNDAKSILDLGDIFLSSSIVEGHPVAVLEAMASEKICFCSDISAHRELGHEYIHLYDLADEFSLLKHLKKYYLNLSYEEEIARSLSARKEIVDNFSIEKMVNSYVEQYN